ncbi:MAG TPA: hypothetical protein VNS32_20215 [Flavisolibacter sp.]|nr:hypothetical protein [Flavisolibacter sp.]
MQEKPTKRSPKTGQALPDKRSPGVSPTSTEPDQEIREDRNFHTEIETDTSDGQKPIKENRPHRDDEE